MEQNRCTTHDNPLADDERGSIESGGKSGKATTKKSNEKGGKEPERMRFWRVRNPMK
jgi:hypothetical protein